MAYLLQNNRKHLSAGNMISLISEGFNSITDYRKNVTAQNSYVECTQKPLQLSKYGKENGENHVSHMKNEQLQNQPKNEV